MRDTKLLWLIWESGSRDDRILLGLCNIHRDGGAAPTVESRR
ncbi:MAG: hypothetical protein ABW185_12435 [Sedimenticola sp.]